MRELGVLGVQRRRAPRRPAAPHCAVGHARRDRRAQRLGLLAALRERALGHHRQRGRELQQHRRPIDDERPPRGERTEPSHVVDLAERRAARRVDEAPEERAERALERRRAARAIRRRGPRACAARGRCRAPSGRGPGRARRPRRTRRARSRRAGSASTSSGRSASRSAPSRLPPLLDEVEDLRGRARDRSSTSPRGPAPRRDRPRGASPGAAPRGGARTRARSPRAR